MSARFTKLEAVDLTDEEEEGAEGESDGGYHVSLVLGGDGEKRRVKRKGSCSRIRSWWWVLIALIAFSISIFVSLMIAELTSEPPQTNKDTTNNVVHTGAVATDSPVCSEMAADILRRDGSAVDATITALLCLGAVHPESSGIGGGGFMVVYHSNGSTAAVDFREAAPAVATSNMFHSDNTLSTDGGLAVAVPGELRGMELAHHHYGRLNWADLFEPVIDLCTTGFNLSQHTALVIRRYKSFIRSSEILREIFTTADGTLKQEGDEVKRVRLAATLKLISMNGADAFYTGTLAENTVYKVNDTGGILTLEDLQNYRAILKAPIRSQYNGYTLYAPPPPSGGAELLFPLNLLSLYTPSPSSSPSSSPSPSDGGVNLTYHRMVEAFKYMFALRSELGDTECEDCDGDAIWAVVANMTSLEYAADIKAAISDDMTHNISYYHAHFATPPSDHGTTHVSVLGPDGMAVSVTSSVNTYFGSKVVTENGIVLNNEMDDFSSPNITNAYGVRPSESNFISPGKRPLSSTCPVIAVKCPLTPGGRVTEYLIAGGAGGTRIPTATAQVVWRVLSLNESISSAIEEKRLHHQLTPNEVSVEEGFPNDVIASLESKGHRVTKSSNHAVVQGIHVNEEGVVSAHSDSRKQGQAVVLNI